MPIKVGNWPFVCRSSGVALNTLEVAISFMTTLPSSSARRSIASSVTSHWTRLTFPGSRSICQTSSSSNPHEAQPATLAVFKGWLKMVRTSVSSGLNFPITMCFKSSCGLSTCKILQLVSPAPWPLSRFWSRGRKGRRSLTRRNMFKACWCSGGSNTLAKREPKKPSNETKYSTSWRATSSANKRSISFTELHATRSGSHGEVALRAKSDRSKSNSTSTSPSLKSHSYSFIAGGFPPPQASVPKRRGTFFALFAPPHTNW